MLIRCNSELIVNAEFAVSYGIDSQGDIYVSLRDGKGFRLFEAGDRSRKEVEDILMSFAREISNQATIPSVIDLAQIKDFSQ